MDAVDVSVCQVTPQSIVTQHTKNLFSEDEIHKPFAAC